MGTTNQRVLGTTWEQLKKLVLLHQLNFILLYCNAVNLCNFKRNVFIKIWDGVAVQIKGM